MQKRGRRWHAICRDIYLLPSIFRRRWMLKNHCAHCSTWMSAALSRVPLMLTNKALVITNYHIRMTSPKMAEKICLKNWNHLRQLSLVFTSSLSQLREAANMEHIDSMTCTTCTCLLNSTNNNTKWMSYNGVVLVSLVCVTTNERFRWHANWMEKWYLQSTQSYRYDSFWSIDKQKVTEYEYVSFFMWRNEGNFTITHSLSLSATTADDEEDAQRGLSYLMRYHDRWVSNSQGKKKCCESIRWTIFRLIEFFYWLK